MTDKKQQARHLYLTGTLTQKQIALEVGVSERTIYTWVHQYAWQKLKMASLQAPATIVDQLSSQLVELNLAIASREPGKRIPTKEESEITQRLLRGISSMKGTQSLGANMQMMQAFRDYVRPLNTKFSHQLAHFADSFFTTKSRSGYAPYQMEYGIEQYAAIMPINDELDGDLPVDTTAPPEDPTPCTSLRDCKKQTGCNYPTCLSNYHPSDYSHNAGTKQDPWPLIPSATTAIQIPNAEFQIPQPQPEPAMEDKKPSEEELLKSWKEVCKEVDSHQTENSNIIESSLPGQTLINELSNTIGTLVIGNFHIGAASSGSNPVISQPEPERKNTLPEQKSKSKSPQTPTVKSPNTPSPAIAAAKAGQFPIPSQGSNPIPKSEFPITNEEPLPRILQFRAIPHDFSRF